MLPRAVLAFGVFLVLAAVHGESQAHEQELHIPSSSLVTHDEEEVAPGVGSSVDLMQVLESANTPCPKKGRDGKAFKPKCPPGSDFAKTALGRVVDLRDAKKGLLHACGWVCVCKTCYGCSVKEGKKTVQSRVGLTAHFAAAHRSTPQAVEAARINYVALYTRLMRNSELDRITNRCASLKPKANRMLGAASVAAGHKLKTKVQSKLREIVQKKRMQMWDDKRSLRARREERDRVKQAWKGCHKEVSDPRTSTVLKAMAPTFKLPPGHSFLSEIRFEALRHTVTAELESIMETSNSTAPLFHDVTVTKTAFANGTPIILVSCAYKEWMKDHKGGTLNKAVKKYIGAAASASVHMKRAGKAARGEIVQGKAETFSCGKTSGIEKAPQCGSQCRKTMARNTLLVDKVVRVVMARLRFSLASHYVNSKKEQERGDKALIKELQSKKTARTNALKEINRKKKKNERARKAARPERMAKKKQQWIDEKKKLEKELEKKAEEKKERTNKEKAAEEKKENHAKNSERASKEHGHKERANKKRANKKKAASKVKKNKNKNKKKKKKKKKKKASKARKGAL